MTLNNAITAFLITGGAVLMGMAIWGTYGLIGLLKASKYYRFWRNLMFFMGFFLIGYIGAVVLVITGLENVLLILTGVVFLFGALFVYLVSKLGYLTIGDLDTMTGKLADQNQQLSVEVMKRKRADEFLNSTLDYMESVVQHGGTHKEILEYVHDAQAQFKQLN